MHSDSRGVLEFLEIFEDLRGVGEPDSQQQNRSGRSKIEAAQQRGEFWRATMRFRAGVR